MAKNKDIPVDMWIYVATDALARYVAAGATLEVAQITDQDGEPAIVIMLPMNMDDPRIAPAFGDLVTRELPATSPNEPFQESQL